MIPNQPRKRGRPKGAKNKRSRNLQDMITKFLEENFEEVRALFYSESMSDKAKATLYVDLLQYAIPKQSSSTLDMKLQALAGSPQFDDIYDKLITQHEKALQSQGIVQPLAIPQTLTNEVPQAEDRERKDGDDDSDYEWVEVDE